MTYAQLIQAYNNHSLVVVKNHDYNFFGIVIAVFYKQSGAQRCVVEDGRGLCLIQSAKNLELYDDS